LDRTSVGSVPDYRKRNPPPAWQYRRARQSPVMLAALCAQPLSACVAAPCHPSFRIAGRPVPDDHVSQGALGLAKRTSTTDVIHPVHCTLQSARNPFRPAQPTLRPVVTTKLSGTTLNSEAGLKPVIAFLFAPCPDALPPLTPRAIQNSQAVRAGALGSRGCRARQWNPGAIMGGTDPSGVAHQTLVEPASRMQVSAARHS
jgi:hypothetical protein